MLLENAVSQEESSLEFWSFLSFLTVLRAIDKTGFYLRVINSFAV